MKRIRMKRIRMKRLAAVQHSSYFTIPTLSLLKERVARYEVMPKA
jgi:hypothetical protein